MTRRFAPYSSILWRHWPVYRTAPKAQRGTGIMERVHRPEAIRRRRRAARRGLRLGTTHDADVIVLRQGPGYPTDRGPGHR